MRAKQKGLGVFISSNRRVQSTDLEETVETMNHGARKETRDVYYEKLREP